jgi:hypothetical protein
MSSIENEIQNNLHNIERVGRSEHVPPIRKQYWMEVWINNVIRGLVFLLDKLD